MGQAEITFLERIRKQLNSDLEPGKEYLEEPANYEREILEGIKWDVIKYGHVSIDRHCPYKQGQLTVTIGHTNVGKSTLIIYLLSRLILRGKKLMLYSAENRISQVARWLIQFAWGTEIHKNYFQWLRENVMFIKHAKQFTYKELLEQIAIAEDLGFCADMIFIDPYNALKLPDNVRNSHEYNYQAIEDMRIFTMQTGKSIFLNCHTVTESQRVKPNQYGEINPPLMSDVEGGSKFPNKADDVWVIHRNLYATDEQERYVSKLYVGKVRNTEGGGFPTKWDEPIRFLFKKDWTGFETVEDKVQQQINVPY